MIQKPYFEVSKKSDKISVQIYTYSRRNCKISIKDIMICKLHKKIAAQQQQKWPIFIYIFVCFVYAAYESILLWKFPWTCYICNCVCQTNFNFFCDVDFFKSSLCSFRLFLSVDIVAPSSGGVLTVLCVAAISNLMWWRRVATATHSLLISFCAVMTTRA